jgi:succinylarginine dihydrolase
MSRAFEVNFDALVGPTHNYAGLAYGNIASRKWKGTQSNPRAAALEGLGKMKFLADLGLKQAVLPPQRRPDLGALRRLGFGAAGADKARVLAEAARHDPALLAAASSASSMWAANAATVSPGADTADGRVHFTPANLVGQFHRSLEAAATAAALRSIFADDAAFAHHPPLPASAQLSDEGAANHLRLAGEHGGRGLEIFVYGRRAFGSAGPGPSIYPARQALEASAAIARLHQLDESAVMFIEQNPGAVDQGVFHNDVAAVSNQQVLLYHKLAFTGGEQAIEEIRGRFARICGGELLAIGADEADLPLAEAVNSYLFNSQLVTLPDGSMSLVAPMECAGCPPARRFIEGIIAADNPIASVHYVQVRQSMRNGGGPACLRLRVVLTGSQLGAMQQGVLLTDALYAELAGWIERHYRTSLRPADLADPALLEEGRRALDELGGILPPAVQALSEDEGPAKREGPKN